VPQQVVAQLDTMAQCVIAEAHDVINRFNLDAEVVESRVLASEQHQGVVESMESDSPFSGLRLEVGR
jgi:hypothetical protein